MSDFREVLNYYESGFIPNTKQRPCMLYKLQGIFHNENCNFHMKVFQIWLKRATDHSQSHFRNFSVYSPV